MSGSTESGAIEIFGPYEVHECLGRGGMASVHRAVKVGIEGFARTVALKRLLSHLAEDTAFIRSFVREARLASHLQHANIVQIYDLGRVENIYYIAMEFIRGRDLRKILKQTAYATGPMPVPMMLSLTRQLCDALDYAHTLADDAGEPLGIVHRDISPSNAIVAADGHLKLIDFGIAKATSNSLRTQTGRVKGKFAYMSPEAIHGRSLDKRSDLFATGIVAWELCTARPLFASKNEYETLRKVTRLDIPPPSHHNPACPPELDEIVLTALAKDPDQRWQSAGAMVSALEHVVKRHGLVASNREITQWLEWAFEQPLQRKRVRPGEVEKPEPLTEAGKRRTLPPSRAAMRSTGPVNVEQLDAVSIEIVWGSGNDDEPTHDDIGSAAAAAAAIAPAGSAASAGSTASGPGPGASTATAPARPALVQGGGRPSTAPAGMPRRAPGGQHARPDSRRSTLERVWPQGTPAGEAGSDDSAPVPTMLGMAPPPESLSQPHYMPRIAPSESAPDDDDAFAGDIGARGTPSPDRSDRSERAERAERAVPPDRAGPLSRPEALADGSPSAGGSEDADTAATIVDGTPSPLVHALAERRRRATAARDAASADATAARETAAAPAADATSEAASAHRARPPVSAVFERAPSRETGRVADGAPAWSSPSSEFRTPSTVDAAAGDVGPREGDEGGGGSIARIAIVALLCVGAAVAGFVLVPGGGGGSGGPPVVAADAVSLREGEPPAVPAAEATAADGSALRVHARVCIDDAGRVASVDVTDAPAAIAGPVASALRGWLYAPYVADGRAIAVCFDVVTAVRPE